MMELDFLLFARTTSCVLLDVESRAVKGCWKTPGNQAKLATRSFSPAKFQVRYLKHILSNSHDRSWKLLSDGFSWNIIAFVLGVVPRNIILPLARNSLVDCNLCSLLRVCVTSSEIYLSTVAFSYFIFSNFRYFISTTNRHPVQIFIAGTGRIQDIGSVLVTSSSSSTSCSPTRQ